MKKVLSIVLNNFTHDSRVLKECMTLQRAKYDVSVLALHDDTANLKEREIVSGITVKRIRLFTKKWPKISIVQVLKYLEFVVRAQVSCNKAEILHCNDLNALIIGVVAKIINFGQSKIIYDAHELECEAGARSYWGKKFLEFIERLAIPFANEVITVSPSIAEDYVQRYGIRKPDLVLNAPSWREDIPQGDVFRQKFSIRKEQKIFLYQGILTWVRGVKELVEAFAARKKDDAVLVFMGYGPAENFCRGISHKYRNIFFHPAVPFDEILNHTCGADYGLIFMHTEGNNNYYYCMPNKFFEYATCGIPFLANDLFDIGRINEKYNMGRLVKTMSVEDINRGIDQLLAEDYDKLSQNARNMAKTYSWENQEKNLLRIYSRLEKRG